MWAAGELVASYEIDLVASKYSTLGTVELPLINFSAPNTVFSVVGFSYSELDQDVTLTDSNSIPRISPDADTKMSLVMENSNTGWMSASKTTFYTDDVSAVPYKGSTSYYSENSNTVPSLLFYLYHSKNLQTAKKNNRLMQYYEKFETETGLISRYSADKAFLIWAMGLYLDIQDCLL